jgi:hypothetical protein
MARHTPISESSHAHERRAGSPSAWVGSSSLWVGLALLSSLGCGASMEAVYEGEVRFERCMALDARADVTPTARRACWHEWVGHYSYAQSRDRIDHAEQRIDELALGVGSLSRAPRHDADDASLSHGSRARDDLGRSEQHAICAGTCEAARDDCAQHCEGGACQRSCALGFQRCILSCG